MFLNFLGLLVLLQSVTFAISYFERCNYAYPIDASRNVALNSPNYPRKYNSGDSCKYTFTAPSFYEIVLQCTINIDKGSACTSEYFLMSSDADPQLRGATQTCGKGNTGIVSEYNTLSFGFISTSQPGSGYGGYFNCTLSVRPQACDCGWSQRGRITNGTAAGATEFPFMVALIANTNNLPYCGGSIISNRCVVTAEHCARMYPTASDTYILAGYPDLNSPPKSVYSRTYDVERIIHHPYYDPSTEENDIALLVIKNDITFSRGVGPICLPLTTTSTFDYASATVLGYGTTSFGGPRSNALLKTSVTVITNNACSNQYNLKSSQLCAYERTHDACQHDSGGPLIWLRTRFYLIGIISYGNGCGGPYPGVYTRVTSLVNWISQNAVGLICNKPI